MSEEPTPDAPASALSSDMVSSSAAGTGARSGGSRAGRFSAATQTLAGAALLITVVTLISRVLGFLRWVAQSNQLGPGGVGAAYNAANLLPNVLFEVAAGGALAGAVIPLLAGPIARRAHVDTSKIASALLGWTLVALVPLGALVALLAGPIIALLPLEDPGLETVATYFLRVFAVQIPLYGLAVVLGGVLQAHKRFFWPAAAPMFSSVVVIATYLVFGSLADGQQMTPEELSAAALGWLAWGTTAGVVALGVPLLVPVWRTGVRLRPTLRFPGGEGRRARQLAFAGIGALVAQQLSVLVVLVAANRFGPEPTFSVFLYAQQVYFLPYAVLAFPLATSTFPRLAEHVAEGRRAAYQGMVSATTRSLLSITAVGVAALIASAAAIEAVFSTFARGSVTGMGAAIAWMAPGLIGYALILHLSRALYVLDRGRAAVVATAAGWLVVTVAAFALPALLGASSQEDVLSLLGLATTLGMTVAGVLLLVAVRRHGGSEAVRGIPRTVVVLLVATAGAALAGGALARFLLPSGASVWAALGVGIVAAALAAVVVLGVSFVGDRAALRALLRRGPGEGPAEGSAVQKN